MSECNRCHQQVVFMMTQGPRNRTVPVDAAEGSDEVIRPRANLSGANLRLTGRSVRGRYGMLNEVMVVEDGEGTYRRHVCPQRPPRP